MNRGERHSTKLWVVTWAMFGLRAGGAGLVLLGGLTGGCSQSHLAHDGADASITTRCDAGGIECDAGLSEESARARALFQEYLALKSQDAQERRSQGCVVYEAPSAGDIACIEAEAIRSPADFIVYLTELNAYLLEVQTTCSYNNCVPEDNLGRICHIIPSDVVRRQSPPAVADAQCACDWQIFDSHLLFCPNEAETDPLNIAIEQYFYMVTRTERKLGLCTVTGGIGFPDRYVACMERRAQAFPDEFLGYFEAVLPAVEARWSCVVGARCEDRPFAAGCPTEEETFSYPWPSHVDQAFDECFRLENRP